MIEEPIRQATGDEILLLLRDRQDELRLLLDEPLAILSMPVESCARILATLPHPPIDDDAPLFITIDDRTVCVPLQLIDAGSPVPCGPWPEHRPTLGDRLDAEIRRRTMENLANT